MITALSSFWSALGRYLPLAAKLLAAMSSIAAVLATAYTQINALVLEMNSTRAMITV